MDLEFLSHPIDLADHDLHPRIALFEQKVQQHGNPEACEGRQQEGMGEEEGHAEGQ